MRWVLALALFAVPSTALHASGADLAGHLQRIRDAKPQGLAVALNDAAKVVRGVGQESEENLTTLAALLTEARRVTELEDGSARSASWRLAVSVLAALKSPDHADAAWFLGHAVEAWNVQTDKEVARAAIVSAVVSLYDESVASGKLGRAAEREVKKTLSSKRCDRGLFVSLALGLALAPTKKARKLLSQSLRRKDLQHEDTVAVLKALGKAGGRTAVSILLDHVPETPAVVLEEALVALFNLDTEVLRKEGKKILAITIEATEAPTHEARALNGRSKLTPEQKARKELLEARRASWVTERMKDTPPMTLPNGASGTQGVEALWWKIVDALKGRVRPPKPAKNARPQFLRGRPNLRGWGWQHWWRGAR